MKYFDYYNQYYSIIFIFILVRSVWKLIWILLDGITDNGLILINFKNVSSESKLFLREVLILILAILLLLVPRSIFCKVVWKRDIIKIKSMNLNTSSKLLINDSLIKYPEEILHDLQGDIGIANNRSSPGKSIELKIINGFDSTIINLYRDNRDSLRYWIYDNSFWTTRNDKIGIFESFALKYF